MTLGGRRRTIGTMSVTKVARECGHGEVEVLAFLSALERMTGVSVIADRSLRCAALRIERSVVTDLLVAFLRRVNEHGIRDLEVTQEDTEPDGLDEAMDDSYDVLSDDGKEPW